MLPAASWVAPTGAISVSGFANDCSFEITTIRLILMVHAECAESQNTIRTNALCSAFESAETGIGDALQRIQKRNERKAY